MNGFKGIKREESDGFQINGLFLDLDCHTDAAKLKTKIWTTLLTISDNVAMGKIPEPTLIIYTGRGLQIYYDYKRSIAYRTRDKEVNSLVYLHKKVVDGMYNEDLDDLDLKSEDVIVQDVSDIFWCEIPDFFGGVLTEDNLEVEGLLVAATLKRTTDLYGPISYEMELQVPYNIYTKVSETGNI